MRFIIVLGYSVFTILLSSCTTTTDNHYTQTIQSWHGGNVNRLVERWGAPDNKVMEPNGNTVYIYKTQSYQNYNVPTSPVVGVNVSPVGTPIISVPPDTNSVWNREPISLSCIAAFEANKEGTIVNTQIQGNGCYGSQGFANSKGNPEVK